MMQIMTNKTTSKNKKRCSNLSIAFCEPQNQRNKNDFLFFSHLSKALAAVYRTVFTWFKWNFCFASASSALCCVHFALRFCSVFTCITAWFTSLWLIYKAFGCIEFLFASSEYKFSAAIFTDESFVFVHVIYLALD